VKALRVGTASASLFALALALGLGAFTAVRAEEPARGIHGMVATDQHLATRAGLDVLEAGGNAVDAAVAAGYALAVADPCCGNIGGGGFMLIHLASGKETFIDFREKAPLRATRTMYLDAKGDVVPNLSTRGYLAVGVPGSVAGLEYAREQYGTKSRQELLAPAIALAREGYVLQQGDVDLFNEGLKDFRQDPVVAAIFTHGGGPLQAGERFRQPDLARSLELISRDGPGAFYGGPIAAAVVAASEKHGGILSLEDFKQYSVDESTPVRCRYHGFDIVSSPPPSSGGTTICEILRIVEPFDFAKSGFHSVAAIHELTEAERLAFLDRNTYLGDPAFVQNPIATLLSNAYIAKQRARIPARAGSSQTLAPGLGAYHEGKNTTHYSIVDRFGNAVAVTYTINDYFGANVIAEGTGFFLNDEMDDFTSKPGVPNLYGLVQGEANAIAPGKRPLSSMSPTIALRDGRPEIVAGSPGGSRIITITLGVLQNIIDYGMNVKDAVDAPRVHHQWLPDEISLEQGALDAAPRASLEALGYKLTERSPWGAAEAITIDPKTHELLGANDRRRPAGSALGY
jgi:gamma-glutamyltranspeptidase/glutathione hydrolase